MPQLHTVFDASHWVKSSPQGLISSEIIHDEILENLKNAACFALERRSNC
jgi:hypothetical protein